MPVLKYALLMLLACNLACLALSDREMAGSEDEMPRLKSGIHIPSTILPSSLTQREPYRQPLLRPTAIPDSILFPESANKSPEGTLQSEDTRFRASSSATIIGTQDLSSHDQKANTPIVSTVEFVAYSTYTNETFATTLCSKLSSTTLTLRVTCPNDARFLLPSCVGTTALQLSEFVGINMIITNFAYLPSTIVSIDLDTSHIDALAGTTSSSGEDGFNADGTINWSELFAHFPNLAKFQVTASYIYGILPTSLPSSMHTLSVVKGFIYGTIPSTLLSGATSTLLRIVNFESNDITGFIPSELMAPLESATSLLIVSINFNGNKLTGTIPEQFIRSGSITRLQISFANNFLQGGLPTSLFKSALPLGSFTLDLSNSNLSGTLPPSLFNAGFSTTTGDTLSLLLSANSFTGPIPTGFLTGNLVNNLTLDSFTLDLSHNDLSGTIPETLFSQTLSEKRSGVDSESGRSRDFSSIQSTVVSIGGTSGQLSLQNNGFEGTLPPSIMNFYLPFDGTSVGASVLRTSPSCMLPNTRTVFYFQWKYILWYHPRRMVHLQVF